MISSPSVLIPSLAADAAHDAAHQTHAQFRHGVYSVPCETCHVPAGELCLARRTVHPARRDLYRKNQEATTLVPLLVGRVR
ncbi:zinc finger domain-containing protein [Streptomyces antibioticus]|uniref:zinc finger domain-containing protein n=1 Tax=Streptomyces antibioticus TaxID=1890 RepID=UPI0034026598